VLFALEEIVGDMNAPLIGSAVLASVSAVIVERSVLGNSPIFNVPQYRLSNPAELFAYVALGIAGGIVSLVFCKGLLYTRQFFLQLPMRSRLYQPALGGLLIGVILIFFPQVLGVGYEYVNQALNGGLLLRTMLLLCLMKLVATIISYASGNAGGIFSPTLYLGAMTGGAVGMLIHQFARFPAADPGAYALVGMGAVFAGIIRAPMTSVFMIFELTQDYQVIVPLMVANMISFSISRQFQPKPLYHALLEQDHVHLPGSAARLSSATWRAGDIMTSNFTMLPPDISATDALLLVDKRPGTSFLVGRNGELFGFTTRERIEQALRLGNPAVPLRNFVVSEYPHIHPDHSLATVIERLKHDKLLPVVSRNESRHVVGVITPEELMRFLEAHWAGSIRPDVELEDKEPAA
jgi:CIC family chloride channel protein